MSARRRLLATLVLPTALVVGPVAGVAAADPPAPAPTPAVVAGAAGTLTFATAARAPITKVEVDLPVDTPLLGVTVPAKAGWTSATTAHVTPSCGDRAVDHVTWTATGAGAAQDGHTFALQVGRFPAAADQIAYRGSVTYADGTVVGFTRPGATVGLPAPFPVAGVPAVTVSAEPTLSTLSTTDPVAPTWTSPFARLMTSLSLW